MTDNETITYSLLHYNNFPHYHLFLSSLRIIFRILTKVNNLNRKLKKSTFNYLNESRVYFSFCRWYLVAVEIEEVRTSSNDSIPSCDRGTLSEEKKMKICGGTYSLY